VVQAQYVTRQLLFLIIVLGAGMELNAESEAEGKFTSGTLRGVTLNPDGQPLPQAKISVHSCTDKYDLTVVSGTDGTFLIARLKPGQYELTAMAGGIGHVIRNRKRDCRANS